MPLPLLIGNSFTPPHQEDITEAHIDGIIPKGMAEVPPLVTHSPLPNSDSLFITPNHLTPRGTTTTFPHPTGKP